MQLSCASTELQNIIHSGENTNNVSMADVMWLKAKGRAFQTEAGKPSKSSEKIVSY